MKLIREVFDYYCKSIVIDNKLLKILETTKHNFINRNSDHSHFFGGHLTGTYVVRFKPTDRDFMFKDILKVDEDILTEHLHSLPDVNPEFKVSSDCYALACMWLCYKINNSSLPLKQKEQAHINILSMLQFKYLTSRLYQHFRSPLNIDIAETVYSQLSGRYSIKQYGTWGKVIENRCIDIIHEKSIHSDVFKTMNENYSVTNALNDIQGRLRDMLKNIYSITKTVLESGAIIKISKATIENEGVEQLKDVIVGSAKYTNYIVSVIPEENNYIKDELITIVKDLLPNLNTDKLKLILKVISEELIRNKELEQIIKDMIIDMFFYIKENRYSFSGKLDIGNVLIKIHGYYTSSKGNSETLLKVRKYFDDYVKKHIKLNNKNVLSNVRTGVILYTLVRALSINHY